MEKSWTVAYIVDRVGCFFTHCNVRKQQQKVMHYVEASKIEFYFLFELGITIIVIIISFNGISSDFVF